MKKLFYTLMAVSLLSTESYSQNLVSGTILPGTAPHRVIIAIRATNAFSGVMTNVQFVLQIPHLSPPNAAIIPSVTLVNNFAPTNIPTASYNQGSTVVNSANPLGYFLDDGVNYNYLFSSVTSGAASFNFTTSTSNLIELEINGAPGTATVKFINLPDGGASGQHAFYIEVGGSDNTNYPAMFFGAGAINGPGGGSGTSFVPLAGVSLPVTFASYDVKCNDKGAVLTWSTATEQNSNRFEIQRSTNGTDWVTIDNVAAAGNSDVLRKYQYVDLNGGTAFYRIRQVDNDGRFVYTAVKGTNCKVGQFDVTLYPVPTRDKLNVVIKSDKAVRTDLQVVDVSGRIVNRTTTQVNKGNNNIVLNLDHLPAGQYMLVSSDPAITINKKFTIIR